MKMKNQVLNYPSSFFCMKCNILTRKRIPQYYYYSQRTNLYLNPEDSVFLFESIISGEYV